MAAPSAESSVVNGIALNMYNNSYIGGSKQFGDTPTFGSINHSQGPMNIVNLQHD